MRGEVRAGGHTMRGEVRAGRREVVGRRRREQQHLLVGLGDGAQLREGALRTWIGVGTRGRVRPRVR